MRKTHSALQDHEDTVKQPRRKAPHDIKHSKGRASLGTLLSDWYNKNHRILPWRADPGTTQDPYRTWLSEIMLQQTTVQAVIPYYNKFLAKWPTVKALANADQAEVMKEWAGLGYYSRARNLHKCAQAVTIHHKGKFPDTIAGLIDLPGIGPYTASAIGSMAFGLAVVPVDGNVERVMSRLYALAEPVATIKPQIKQSAQDILDNAPGVFPGDLAQALMDLGATVCTPKSPKCLLCPLHDGCTAYKAGNPGAYPTPPEKKAKPTRMGEVYLIENEKGEFLVTRRPGKGLLGGMNILPTTDWIEQRGTGTQEIKVKNPVLIGEVRHSFTHFDLIMQVIRGKQGRGTMHIDGTWHASDILKDVGLPRVFLKAALLLAPKEGRK